MVQEDVITAMIKVVNIVGARPQFIKYFPVSRSIRQYNRTGKPVIKDILIHTGQHYDYFMSKVFFDEFRIREPDHHLDVGSGTHGKQTGLILERTEELLQRLAPDVVIVYGDTNSTLGGALAAAKLHLPVMHVEAGLRSFFKQMPEEVNRVLTDHISSWLLCPSRTAVDNLKREGFPPPVLQGDLVPPDFFSRAGETRGRATSDAPLVINLGDIMYDVLLYARKTFPEVPPILGHLSLAPKAYCLLTWHRAENTDSPEQIAEIIDFVSHIAKDRPVVFPIHPRTKKALAPHSGKFPPNLRIIDPLGYYEMMALLQNSALALTDSGGLQKEAYWLRVPCITLRRETEWTETIDSGWNILFKDYQGPHLPQSEDVNAYGDGRTARRIVELLAAAKD